MSALELSGDILLDTDVIIHFFKGGSIRLINQIYPDRVAVTDVVQREVKYQASVDLNQLIQTGEIRLIPFPVDFQVLQEFAALGSNGFRGEGENSCMAIAKFHPSKIIASSNLRDISPYCSDHGIKFITTMDILLDGWISGVMSERQCDQFIRRVRASNSKLPDISIRSYRLQKGM
ncbi:MAG: hypothetical protein H6581_19920 [Bacteroidia bacterium]|nr:hypothetical protein [Bacteroidia bacterium]